VYFASWDYFISTYAPSLPHVGTCAGEPFAAIAGDVILSSYLVLFISFYIATYKNMGKKDKSSVAKKAERSMEKAQVPSMKETAQRATEGVKSANNTLYSRKPTQRESEGVKSANSTDGDSTHTQTERPIPLTTK
jgi:fatty acid elongase 3